MPALEKALSAKDLSVFPISGVTHQGTDKLMGAIRVLLEERAIKEREQEAEPEVYVFRAVDDPDAVSVERKRGSFRVHGETVERIVSMTNLESEEAIDHLQRRLKRLGVFSALQRNGIRPGNRVVIGPIELVWEGEMEPVVKRAAQTTPRSRRQSGRGTGAYREHRQK